MFNDILMLYVYLHLFRNLCIMCSFYSIYIYMHYILYIYMYYPVYIWSYSILFHRFPKKKHLIFAYFRCKKSMFRPPTQSCGGVIFGGVAAQQQTPMEAEPDFGRWPEVLVATPGRYLDEKWNMQMRDDVGKTMVKQWFLPPIDGFYHL